MYTLWVSITLLSTQLTPMITGNDSTYQVLSIACQDLPAL